MTVESRALKHLLEAYAVGFVLVLITFIHLAMRVPGFTAGTQFDIVESIMFGTGVVILLSMFFRFNYELSHNGLQSKRGHCRECCDNNCDCGGCCGGTGCGGHAQ